MVFRVGGRTAFAVPLPDVSQAQQGREEVMLEFPVDDSAAGGLAALDGVALQVAAACIKRGKLLPPSCQQPLRRMLVRDIFVGVRPAERGGEAIALLGTPHRQPLTLSDVTCDVDHPAGDREDTLVEMSFYVPKENEDFAAQQAAKAAAAAAAGEGEVAEDVESAAVAPAPEAPAKYLFDLVSQYTDAGAVRIVCVVCTEAGTACMHAVAGSAGCKRLARINQSNHQSEFASQTARRHHPIFLPLIPLLPASPPIAPGAATGDAVATFDQVGVLVPRGRFDIEMYLGSLKLVGQVGGAAPAAPAAAAWRGCGCWCRCQRCCCCCCLQQQQPPPPLLPARIATVLTFHLPFCTHAHVHTAGPGLPHPVRLHCARLPASQDKRAAGVAGCGSGAGRGGSGAGSAAGKPGLLLQPLLCVAPLQLPTCSRAPFSPLPRPSSSSPWTRPSARARPSTITSCARWVGGCCGRHAWRVGTLRCTPCPHPLAPRMRSSSPRLPTYPSTPPPPHTVPV